MSVNIPQKILNDKPEYFQTKAKLHSLTPRHLCGYPKSGAFDICIFVYFVCDFFILVHVYGT